MRARTMGAVARGHSQKECARMLDSLLEVQRTLTKNRDHQRLALLYALTDSLQEEYLSHLERIAKGGAR